jgi:hypothetical protein
VAQPREQLSGEPRGLDLAVSGLDQAVAVLDAEIETLEAQLQSKKDERRELQQTRTRLAKLGGNSSTTGAAARVAPAQRARPPRSRSASGASAEPAAAGSGSARRSPRRSGERAPTADRETAIIRAVTSNPMTAVEAAKAVGLSQPRARQILKELRDSGRLRVEEVPSGRGRPTHQRDRCTSQHSFAGCESEFKPSPFSRPTRDKHPETLQRCLTACGVRTAAHAARPSARQLAASRPGRASRPTRGTDPRIHDDHRCGVC